MEQLEAFVGKWEEQTKEGLDELAAALGLSQDQIELYKAARTEISYSVDGDNWTINVGPVGEAQRTFYFKLGEEYSSKDLDGTPMTIKSSRKCISDSTVYIMSFSITSKLINETAIEARLWSVFGMFSEVRKWGHRDGAACREGNANPSEAPDLPLVFIESFVNSLDGTTLNEKHTFEDGKLKGREMEINRKIEDGTMFVKTTIGGNSMLSKYKKE